MEPSTSSPPPRLASPWADDDNEQLPPQGYDAELQSVLNNGTATPQDEDDEDEEEFGGFVYSGVDVEPPEQDEEQPYSQQLDEVLSDAASRSEGDAASSTSTSKEPTTPNGKHFPVLHLPVRLAPSCSNASLC